jgi:transposase
MSNRRKFSAEFKAEAVELVISSGRSVVQVSADIGVNEGTLGNWVRTWRQEHPEAVLMSAVRWNGLNIGRFRLRMLN